MATTLLLIGVPNALTEDVVYALPTRAAMLKSTVAVEVSNLTNSGFAVLANSTVGTVVAAMFVQCTTAAATLVLKV